MLVLRTSRRFYRSRPAPALVATSALIAVLTLTLPYSPAADALGLVGPPATMLAALVALTVLYVAANELAKPRFLPPES